MSNGNNRTVIFSIFGLAGLASVAWLTVSVLAPSHSSEITILLGFLGLIASQIMSFKQVVNEFKDVHMELGNVKSAVGHVIERGENRDIDISVIKNQVQGVGNQVDGALHEFFERFDRDREMLLRGGKAQRALGRQEGKEEEQKAQSEPPEPS